MASSKLPVDHTGKRFGRLVVMKSAGRKDRGHNRRRPAWLCRCDCGQTTVVVSGELTSGHTQSCGCRQRDLAQEASTTHGRSKSAEYRIWTHIIGRCDNKTDASYKNYGGRGIRVCRRWRTFENFLADMGERPSNKHTIERVKNDRNYSPANCVWATRLMQNRNRRGNRMITFDGRKRLIVELAEEFGIAPRTLRKRIDKGIPIGIALRKGRLPSDWKSLRHPGPR